jgi:uncharacterized membrane protein HdeD (DUF308 family)
MATSINVSLVHAFQGGGWEGMLGVLTSVFGLILVFNPLIDVVALPFILGGFMIVGGIAGIVASFRLHSCAAGTAAT